MKADQVNVRYMVEDVNASIEFYTKQLGFKLGTNASPAFAEVTKDNLRLLLSGRKSSAGRAMLDGTLPVPGGWNRIHFVVENLSAEVIRLKSQGVHFRNDIVTGPGGSQILLVDPSGNLIELFEPKDGK
jgi:catechol 2,3-dioxygenase-like lactoylglutathione lyase family enzyme